MNLRTNDAGFGVLVAAVAVVVTAVVVVVVALCRRSFGITTWITRTIHHTHIHICASPICICATPRRSVHSLATLIYIFEDYYIRVYSSYTYLRLHFTALQHTHRTRTTQPQSDESMTNRQPAEQHSTKKVRKILFYFVLCAGSQRERNFLAI